MGKVNRQGNKDKPGKYQRYFPVILCSCVLVFHNEDIFYDIFWFFRRKYLMVFYYAYTRILLYLRTVFLPSSTRALLGNSLRLLSWHETFLMHHNYASGCKRGNRKSSLHFLSATFNLFFYLAMRILFDMGLSWCFEKSRLEKKFWSYTKKGKKWLGYFDEKSYSFFKGILACIL